MCLRFLHCLLQHSSLCPIDLVVSASFHRRIASLLSRNVNCYALWYLGRYLLPRLAFWVCIYGGGVEIASYVVSRNKVELNTEKHSNVSIFGRFPQDWCMPSCQHLFVALDCTSATLQTHFLPLFLSPSSSLSHTNNLSLSIFFKSIKFLFIMRLFIFVTVKRYRWANEREDWYFCVRAWSILSPPFSSNKY